MASTDAFRTALEEPPERERIRRRWIAERVSIDRSSQRVRCEVRDVGIDAGCDCDRDERNKKRRRRSKENERI
jgi:hypothetical protein